MTSKAGFAVLALMAAAAIVRSPDTAAAKDAGQEPPLKIGMVNLEECFDKEKYAYTKDVNGELEQMRAEMATEIDALAKRLSDLGEQIKGLDKKTGLYQQKLQQYKELDAMTEVKTKFFQARLKAQQRTRWTEIYNEICRVVNLVSAEGKYDMVFRKEEPILDDDSPEIAIQRISSRVVLYANERFDITKSVIQRLNQEYAKKKGAAASPPPASPTPSPTKSK